MKYLYFITAITLFLGCTPAKHVPTTRTIVTDESPKDSVIYVETEIEAKQKNSLDLLIGSWDVITMQRQTRLKIEPLTNTYFSLNENSSFNGKSGCNNISGQYVLKGTGIKFTNISSTKMHCANTEQETAFLQLLSETVSAYTVSKDSLLLRDGSANIIFRAVRR